jgi:hypothetical protein
MPAGLRPAAALMKVGRSIAISPIVREETPSASAPEDLGRPRSAGASLEEPSCRPKARRGGRRAVYRGPATLIGLRLRRRASGDASGNDGLRLIERDPGQLQLLLGRGL